MQGVPATRDIFTGPQETLVDALRPFVTKPGWVKYCEDAAEKVDKHLLFQHAPLIRALHNVQRNMSFSRRVMTSALLVLAAERGFFKDSPSMLSEWSRVCSARARTLGRHMAQSILKARGCHSSWVALVMSPTATQVLVKRTWHAGPPTL